MKKVFLLALMLMLGMIGGVAEARQAEATTTASDLIQGFLTAYNGHDLYYFERTIASDVVALDEDGHTLRGKELVMRILGKRLSATPAPQLTAENVTGSNTADAAWGSLNYTFEQGDVTRKGFISLVFEKSGDDWQIAHWQFSIHTAGDH